MASRNLAAAPPSRSVASDAVVFQHISTGTKSSKSSLLRRFFRKPRSQQTIRTSAVSLTSIDEDPAESGELLFRHTLPRTTLRCSSNSLLSDCSDLSLPHEVEIVQESQEDNDDDDLLDHQAPEETFSEKDEEQHKANKGEVPLPLHLQQANACREKALDCMDVLSYNCALEELACGIALVHKGVDEPQPKLYWDMVFLKAQVLGQMGRYEESLACYQQKLQHMQAESSPTPNPSTTSELANLFFACARLSVHLQNYEQAMTYYQQELDCCVHTDSLAISRIHHELARVAHRGLHDVHRAMHHYQLALKVEHERWKSLISQKDATPEHILQDAVYQVQHTRRSLGRLHFEQGHVDRAVALAVQPM
uniref:Uncharacterized protein n=1 Tax=Phaeodactylum tricornutum TaxID=2850 RepID=A0A8J9SKM6_PHATR